LTQEILVVLDFPGIKNHVFGTDRLVEIRGASALLDKLNRLTIPEMLKKHFGNQRYRFVFSGGGAGQFIIQGTESEIDTAFKEIKGMISEKSGGALRLAMGMAALDTNHYEKSLETTFLKLKKDKNEKPFEPFSSIHNGFVRDCDSCSGMASFQTRYAGILRCLCRSCFIKQETGTKRGLWDEFCTYLLQNHGFDPEAILEQRPNDFEEIGQRCVARNGYTALVYGDGNAMGRLVKQIDSEDRFKRFSTAVDESVREACHEALYHHCHPVNGKIPADILLLGGDDLMVYLAADTAIPFALEVAHRFEAKTKEKLVTGNPDPFFKHILGDNGLTISMGVAFGRSHTPISIMVSQSEELLKSAKHKGTKLSDANGYTPACLDFHVTSQFNQARVSDSRKHHMMIKSHDQQIHLFKKPYTLKDAKDLLTHARRLKESGIPNSRLHRLGEAPFKGKINGIIDTLALFGRCRKSQEKLAIYQALSRFDCMKLMPWTLSDSDDDISTVMVDLVELTSFIPIKKEV
jgi:hypothetical protein